MPRRSTPWWVRFVSTAPSSFLKREDGRALVDLLSNWWTTGEGFADGSWNSVDHSAGAVRRRYSQPAFYSMLDAVQYPELPDRDQNAVDAIHRAFLTWASGRQARKLVTKLDGDLRPDAALDPAADIAASAIHHNVQHQVHQHVHHQVQHHVHAQVHHAVSHAAAHAGGGAGGHGGGGHGGH